MKHPARWTALAVGVVVAALAVVLATQVGTNPQAEEQTSRLVGQNEPAFTIHTFDGQTISSATLAGKVVLVNFWNSWCIPCQQELPALKSFYAEHTGDPNVVLLGILTNDTVDAARPYAEAEGMNWPLANDPGATLALAFGTRGQPETYAISAGGLVVGSEFGPASLRTLDTLLTAAQARP